MQYTPEQLSNIGRNAAASKNWPLVKQAAENLIELARDSAEGYFLLGLAERSQRRPAKALAAFQKALNLDSSRYDAAIELANQYSIARQNAEAAALLDQYSSSLKKSPMYLDLAATVYTEIGMAEKAWPLFVAANKLQPEIELFKANMASCAVYLGKIDLAKRLYRELIDQNPNHRRYHYHYSRLFRAENKQHIEEMERALSRLNEPDENNIFMFYALGKEYEDIGDWANAFSYYKRGGDAVNKVANYRIDTDLEIIDKIIETCTAEWMSNQPSKSKTKDTAETPVFIVGLPRTGTTLLERILSSHSRVSSLDETLFIQMLVRKNSGVLTRENISAEIIAAAAKTDTTSIAEQYMECVRYRLGPESHFIDKLPLNFLYAGFIAKAWPNAKIVYLDRNPMDACFAMFKQVFTWAYKYSYNLEHLGKYYVAHRKLLEHWRNVLGDRLIEIRYEDLVSDTEMQTRRILKCLNLNFEQACLDFHKNKKASTTASSVQVRQKVYSSSVGKWKKFEKELKPIINILTSAGIEY